MRTLVSTGRVSSDISNVVEVARTPASRAQFDPQPGDTMSDTSDDMYTYTVTSVEGDGDPHNTWVHSTYPDGTSDGGWPLWLWSESCAGRFVYARP